MIPFWLFPSAASIAFGPFLIGKVNLSVGGTSILNTNYGSKCIT